MDSYSYPEAVMREHKVAVLIPTRDRPDSFRRAVESIKVTSEADVLAYLDDDGLPYPEQYRARFIKGPRIGPAKAWQKLAEEAMKVGYAAVATLTDDSVITTPGWDQWMLRQLRLGETRVQAFRPVTNDEGAYRMDMPAVSREWIEAVGWFIHPEMKHYCWPSVIDAMSFHMCLTTALPHEFRIQHHQEGTDAKDFEEDSINFYRWYVWHKDEARRSLATKIDAAFNQERAHTVAG